MFTALIIAAIFGALGLILFLTVGIGDAASAAGFKSGLRMRPLAHVGSFSLYLSAFFAIIALIMGFLE